MAMHNYTFSGNYSTLNTKKKLERLPNREMKEMLDSGIDVYTLVYKPFGLTQEDFTSDLNSGVEIATLRKQSGEYVSVPETYVSRDVDEFNNVNYIGRGIVMDLGGIPEAENIDSTLEDILTYIEARLGITAKIRLVNTATISVSEDDHTAYESERELLRNDKGNYYNQLLMCKKEKDSLQTYVDSLEECIKEELCDC
jgi:hypothetical protein